MSRKKALALGLTVVLAAGLLVGCGSSEKAPQETSTQTENTQTETDTTEVTQENGTYADGIYFAQEDGFAEKSGWKYMVTLEVKDGKITKADWNGAYVKGGVDKKTSSKSGEYGMVAKGKSIAEWHEQAELVEAYLLETQDPLAITYTSDDGQTDAISGATIKVKEFFELSKKALANEPTGSGKYKDGAYHAEQSSFDEKTGWKYMVDATVVNGYIVAVDWNGTHKDGGDDKDTQSKDGRYGMVAKGKSIAEWHEQAELVEAYLLQTQDPSVITYTSDDGKSDAISGATIKMKEFFELAQEALASAK